MNIRPILSVLAACAALCANSGVIHAQIYVTNFVSGTIGEYNATTGATINSAWVSGLDSPYGLALSGGKLFVANEGGPVGVYDAATGATINASLISLGVPVGIAVSGNKLFVVDRANGTIGEYTNPGAPRDPGKDMRVSGFPYGIEAPMCQESHLVAG